jgi:rRNA maturation endonuclease Nob1
MMICNNCNEEFETYTDWENCQECGANICFDCITDYDGNCPICGSKLTDNKI